jgi:hypothetical protein
MGTDIHIRAEVFYDGRWRRAEVDLPDNRDYWTFALLAGVRNGTGFAGCTLGRPVTPLSPPRGLPADAEWEESDRPGGLWLGDHDKSWLTLAELMTIDLDAPITRRVMVSKEDAERLRTTGERPSNWCGGTTRSGWERVEYDEPIRTAAPLLVDIIADLKWLVSEREGVGPEQIRIVFGFDS